MPAEFPPAQDEPTLAETPELSTPEPGISSREVLDAAAVSAPPPLGRSPGGAAAKTPLSKSGVLSRFPKDAGAPVLMTTPHSAPSLTAATQALPRDRTPNRVIPAKGEELVDSGLEVVPDFGEVPAPPGELPEPTETAGILEMVDEVGPEPAETPGPARGGRSRGPAIPQPATVPVPETEMPSFDLSDSGLVNEPPSEPVPEPVDVTPVLAPGTPRSRTPLPTPREEVTPTEVETEPAPLRLSPDQRPARTPTHTHAIGEDLPANPPQRSSIPSTATPAKPITPEMLIGNATVEDPLLTPTQQPQLRIEKKAQAEAEVGEKFVYEIIVQNVGSVPAQYVVVEERIPKGTTFTRSNPQAALSRDRILRWNLETMQPNTQRVIKIEVTPTEAGPVGSVATVRFAAQVATKTIVTAPTLSLSIKHPQEVAVGEQVPVKLVITNSGTGVARKPSLRAVLQEGLKHDRGLDLDLDIESLAPGQTKEVDLFLTAVEAGHYTPHLSITSNGIEQENRTIELSVIESRLTLSREGHARRFVDRPAEFITKITNHSVESMKDVIITETLPEGVTPVGEMRKFSWDPKGRTVMWKVSELGPGQHSDLKLSVVSAKAGTLTGKVQAVAASGHRAELPTELEVQGFSSLTLDFQGDGKAVAIGDQVSMRVTVGNRGSAPAKQVQALFELPPQMTFVAAKGSDNITATQEGNLVTFAVLDELLPNSNQTYDIVLIAAQEGRPLVEVELLSTDLPESIHQQESVTITP